MRLLTVLFAMAFAAYADADTITKRDGTTVDGTITTCGEENCLIGSGGIARAEIARIDLAKPERMPAIDASESDVLVTIDGTIHIGTLTFLNLGYVSIGEHDVERDQVAVIVMLGASPKDVIVFRNGRERSGRLVRCNASACTLDEESLPREQIVWIGLQQEGARPPRGDATVYLRDDSTAPGPLVSIDAETVRAGERSFARNDVAWVRIESGAAAAPAADDPGARSGHRSTAQRGGLWTGTMTARLHGVVDGTSSELNVEINVRLRGSYTAPSTGAFEQIEVSWDVARSP